MAIITCKHELWPFTILLFPHTGKEDRQSWVPLCARSGFDFEKNSADFSKSRFGGHSETEGIKMRRSEKVEATLTAEEKEIFRRLCDEAGCTEAELIRSVLISRSISLDDLETKKIERVKNKTLQKQGRKHAPEKTDERGEAIAEKRDVSFHVMLTAPEKKAIEQRAAALGISVSELVRRSAIYGKIESFNFDIAEVEKLHHELLKEGTNLNQLMYFVNAQGLPAYNEKAVFRTLEKVYQNARKVDRFIEELEKRYHVDYVPHDYLADEPDNRNL